MLTAAALLLCLVVFVFGLVLRSVGLSMVRRAERQMREIEHARWRDSA